MQMPPPKHPRPHGLPLRGGVGLKPKHHATNSNKRPDAGYLEVGAECCMDAGEPLHRLLAVIRRGYPQSLHEVGLSIGTARDLDGGYLQCLRTLTLH